MRSHQNQINSPFRLGLDLVRTSGCFLDLHPVLQERSSNRPSTQTLHLPSPDLQRTNPQNAGQATPAKKTMESLSLSTPTDFHEAQVKLKAPIFALPSPRELDFLGLYFTEIIRLSSYWSLSSLLRPLVFSQPSTALASVWVSPFVELDKWRY